MAKPKKTPNPPANNPASPVAYSKGYEVKSIESISPYEKNPRKIPQKAVDKVAASIKRFGWQWPILVDAKGVIVAGHTRYAAAKQLGYSEVPVAVFTGNAKAAREFRIADNRVGSTDPHAPAAILQKRLSVLCLAVIGGMATHGEKENSKET